MDQNVSYDLYESMLTQFSDSLSFSRTQFSKEHSQSNKHKMSTAEMLAKMMNCVPEMLAGRKICVDLKQA